jgi:hypothetical protein
MRTSILLLSLWFVASAPAFADGLVYKGHINGPRTVLTLTDKQATEVEAGLKRDGAKEIELTPEQAAVLVAKVPKCKGIGRLLVLPRTTDTCSCHAANVAIRLSKRKIEVADNWLGQVSCLEEVRPAALPKDGTAQ